jgi:G:T-mismatch repair DNA endonuclease (very short patch repair protein)
MSTIINGVTFNKKITEEQIQFLKDNYNSLKFKELQDYLKISDETLYRLLKALCLKRQRKYNNKIPTTPEAIQMLKDPYISHVKLADMWGCTESAVGHKRKAMNVSVRRNVSMNRLEEKIKNILDELDLAYIYEKKINQWSIDFYLGQKNCIDVHGSWSHDFEKQKLRDARKIKELTSMGYNYCIILEKDIDIAKETILQFLRFPLEVTLGKKPCEPLPVGVHYGLTVDSSNELRTIPCQASLLEEGVETIENSSNDES